MKYYDAVENWSKIKRHINKPEIQAVLIRDFNKFTYGRWRQRFEAGRFPDEFESCDWRWGTGRRGRHPAFWRYVKHAACHWLVNFNLKLAQETLPGQPWRVLTSQAHSTVWDGKHLLFDFNFQALGISPKECFKLANTEELPVGEELEVAFAEHYGKEK